MDRRIAIKNLALVLGGATLFPKDLLAGNVTLIKLNNLQVNPAQEKLLADVAETIIPKTTTPGARDMGLHLFVLTMVDDCYGKNDQQQFMTGLDQFKTIAAKKNPKAFALWPAAQREAFLLSIEQKNDYPQEMNRFYHITKDKVVQGYTQSKLFMTKVIPYELIPSRYLVDVPVKTAQSKSAAKHG